MLTILIIIAIILFIILVAGIFMVISCFTGAPYVALPQKHVEQMILHTHLKKNQKLIDLGSGNGKLLLAALEHDIRAIGYEINPILCAITWVRILLNKNRHLGKIYCTNFWKVDFSSTDAIVLYGVPHIMDRLQKKIQKECKKGTPVISFGFEFPHWEMTKKDGRIKIYKA